MDGEKWLVAPESSAHCRGCWSHRTLHALSAAVIFDGVGLLGLISNWRLFGFVWGVWWTLFSFLLERAMFVVYNAKLVVVAGCLLILLTKFAWHMGSPLPSCQVELS